MNKNTKEKSMEKLNRREFGNGEGKGVELEWRGQNEKPGKHLTLNDADVFSVRLEKYIAIACGVIVVLMIGYITYVQLF